MADDMQDDLESGGPTPKKGYTPPKGRRTRGRDEVDVRRRAFGPVAQWVTLALAVVVVVVVVILVTNGGDFNPYDDDNGAPAGSPVAAPAASPNT
jgi:hypothetical protein